MNYAFDKKAVRELYYGPIRRATKATLVYPTPVDVRARPHWQTAWDALPAYDQDLEQGQAASRRVRSRRPAATARPSPTTSRHRRSRASASRFIDAMSQLGHHDRGPEGHLPGGRRAAVRAARRLRHHRRHVGVRTSPTRPATCGPNFASREHRWPAAPMPRRYTNARRSTSCSHSRTRSRTRPSGPEAADRGPGASSPRTRRSSSIDQPGLAARDQQAGARRRGRRALVLGLAVQGPLGHQ